MKLLIIGLLFTAGFIFTSCSGDGDTFTVTGKSVTVVGERKASDAMEIKSVQAIVQVDIDKNDP